ncbi:hypothetical protein [Actinomadura sp. WAC 06369]|uniref:hypothetical protein n=1 Tax=Actinomadura sp. WAC 06369 TaxID=2203193 RepID=UPI000F7A452E|nr:hypothetical protein [Actinomadura sp. WAC 06369]RSN56808.1 hypothetical protein DMH08_24545 [Actinomadura sp. WAC 06369]
MRSARPVLLRGGLLVGGTLLGLVLVYAARLWWGTTASAIAAVLGMIANAWALGYLYASGRSFRFSGVPLGCGMLALFLMYVVGASAARDIALLRVGTDIDAVVDRTWTTKGRGFPQHHCTLRRTDGTPIERAMDSACDGREPGDVIPVVLDRRGRLAPVAGSKSDMSATGELQVIAGAGLVILVSVALAARPAARGAGPRPGR